MSFKQIFDPATHPHGKPSHLVGTELDGYPTGPFGDGPRRLVDVANGTIKRLVRDRGFGFIKDDGGQEWFFHRSSVKAGSFDQLNEGQRVIFDEEPSQKGPRAGNIRAES
jgi:CspA family cold shock protein